MSASGKSSSRSQVLCPILGKPDDLKTNVLPTTEELLKFYLHLKLESNSKKPTGLLFKIVVVDAVILIWETSCLPIVSKPRGK